MKASKNNLNTAKYIQILDCTLRDGGFALEDASMNGISSLCFGTETIDKIVHTLKKSKIDIIELGAIEITQEDKRDIAIYQNIESISKKIPKDRSDDQMYAALYRGPDVPIEDIPDWHESYCDAVRVIIRYSELQKSLDFCKALVQKGYKVFIQPMLTSRYKESEIQLLIDAANDMDAYALYFVDSYGYMQEKDGISFFTKFDTQLNASIRIGFHAHNNMNLAFSNVLTFINQQSSREIIVDSCILGMGQGAGNLQTEIITDYMNRNHGYSYNYTAVLDTCEIIEKFWTQNLWGYSVTHLLPAIHKTAYKFSVALRDKYGLSFSKINHILSNIPEDLRHRYTPENTVKLLEMFDYDKSKINDFC